MAKQTSCDGPGADAKQLFKPGDAASMPTKHYPSSGGIGKTKADVVEGPGTANKSLHR